MKIKDNLVFKIIFLFFLNGTVSITHWIIQPMEMCDICQEPKLSQTFFFFNLKQWK